MRQLPPKPLLTIYRPSQTEGRWTARADINAGGELIELQATASTELAHQAMGWYNKAAEKIGRYVRIDTSSDPHELSGGVFSDVPEIAAAVAASPHAIPAHPNITAASDLYLAAYAGNEDALHALKIITEAAPTDQEAAEALSDLLVVECAHQHRERLPMARVFSEASQGDEDALKVMAALRIMTPASPTRLSWNMDEWKQEGPRVLCGDVISACADEIGARIVHPSRFDYVRQVKPFESTMLSTYQAILAAYGG